MLALAQDSWGLGTEGNVSFSWSGKKKNQEYSLNFKTVLVPAGGGTHL